MNHITIVRPSKSPISIPGSHRFPSGCVVSPRLIGTCTPISQQHLTTAKPPMELRYRRPNLNKVENVEMYTSGGLHPIHLGDSFRGGSYRILHKLGYGGFSTVWLARDQNHDRLVSLKVLTAEASRQATELKLLQHLDQCAQGNPCRRSITSRLDDFTFDGPNGTHLCYVSQPGGPSISDISHSPGEIAGTRRLRARLARKLARQLAKTVSFMHHVGIVHGDITPKNVLLRLSGIDAWPTETIYQQLGRPVTEEVFTHSGQLPDVSAPGYLVAPASFSCVDFDYISEQILLIDLAEGFLELSPPPNGVGTPVSYRSPELILEKKASRASDIWALARTIFEMRSGFPLFESFVGSSSEILEEIVRIIGLPPEPFHPLWKQNGVAIADQARLDASILDDRVREIGMYDQESCLLVGDVASLNHDTILEPPGASITRDEANELSDLLRRALDYMPEKRLSAGMIANSPWLVNNK